MSLVSVLKQAISKHEGGRKGREGFNRQADMERAKGNHFAESKKKHVVRDWAVPTTAAQIWEGGFA